MRRNDNIIQNYRPSDKDVLLGITPLIAYQFCDTSYQSYQNGFSAPNEYDWAMTALASFVALGILSRFVNWDTTHGLVTNLFNEIIQKHKKLPQC